MMGVVIISILSKELNGKNALYWYLSKDEKISINIKTWNLPFIALKAISLIIT